MKEKLLFLFLTIILVLIIIFAVFIMNNVNNKEKIDEKYIETENTDIIVIEANNENFEKICSKYNIQAMPTIIVFKQGKIINSSVGLVSKEDIKALFENK